MAKNIKSKNKHSVIKAFAVLTTGALIAAALGTGVAYGTNASFKQYVNDKVGITEVTNKPSADTSAELSSLKDQLYTLTAQYTELNNKYTTLKSENDSIASELTEKQAALSASLTEKADLENQLKNTVSVEDHQKVADELAIRNEEIAKYTDEITNLQNDLEKSNAEMKSLDDGYNKKYTEFYEQIIDFENRIAELEAQIKDLTTVKDTTDYSQVDFTQYCVMGDYEAIEGETGLPESGGKILFSVDMALLEDAGYRQFIVPADVVSFGADCFSNLTLDKLDFNGNNFIGDGVNAHNASDVRKYGLFNGSVIGEVTGFGSEALAMNPVQIFRSTTSGTFGTLDFSNVNRIIYTTRVFNSINAETIKVNNLVWGSTSMSTETFDSSYVKNLIVNNLTIVEGNVCTDINVNNALKSITIFNMEKGINSSVLDTYAALNFGSGYLNTIIYTDIDDLTLRDYTPFKQSNFIFKSVSDSPYKI